MNGLGLSDNVQFRQDLKADLDADSFQKRGRRKSKKSKKRKSTKRRSRR